MAATLPTDEALIIARDDGRLRALRSPRARPDHRRSAGSVVAIGDPPQCEFWKMKNKKESKRFTLPLRRGLAASPALAYATMTSPTIIPQHGEGPILRAAKQLRSEHHTFAERYNLTLQGHKPSILKIRHASRSESC